MIPWLNNTYTKVVFSGVDNCARNKQFIRMSTCDPNRTKNEIVTHLRQVKPNTIL